MPSKPAPAAERRRSGAHPTIAECLRSVPAELIERALVLRPDLAEPPPTSVSQLAVRVVHPGSVSAALSGIDRWVWQVAEAALVIGGPTSAAEIAALMRTCSGSTPELAEVDAGLDRLIERLLAFREPDGVVWLNPGLLDAIGTPGNLGLPVRALLDGLNADELRGMAKWHGGPGHAKRRAELLDLAVTRLTDPVFVTELIAGAPDPARLVLEQALEATVELPYDASYFRVSTYGRDLDDPYRWLLARGLLFGSWGIATVPREVGLAMRGGVVHDDAQPTPPAVAVADVDPAAIDRAGASRATTTVRLVARLIEELAVRPAESLKAGGLGVREIRRIAKSCDVAEANLRLALEIARVAGLVCPAWSAVAPTEDGEAFAAAEPAAQWIILAEAWLAHDGAPLGVNGIKDPTGTSIPAGVPVNGVPAAPVRDAILAVLGDLAADQAVTGPMHDAIAWRAPAAFDRLGRLDDLGGQVIDWLIAEAEALGVIASGAITSVGRALHALDRGTAASAAAELVRPAPATVIVQADNTIVVDAGAPPWLLGELRVLADVESTGAAVVLRISSASVRRALDSGRTGDQLLSVLREHAAAGVPQPVAYLIDDVARRWGEVRVGNAGCYVRADDPATLAEAVAHRKLARLGLRLIAPTVAVSDQPGDEVLELLRQAGFLPAAEGADGATVQARPSRHRAPTSPARQQPLGRSGRRVPTMTADERRQLVESLLGASDEPTPPEPPARLTGWPGRGRLEPNLFDGMGLDELAAALGGILNGSVDSVDLDDVDIDDDEDLDDVDLDLIELMVNAEVDENPVELMRVVDGSLRSVTGRVAALDLDALVAVIVEEPGGTDVLVELDAVVAFRPLDAP